MKSSEEIIKEYVETLLLNKKTYNSIIKEEEVLIPPLNTIGKQNKFVFTHIMYVTKLYHNKTCAIFRLLTFLDFFLSSAEIVYFRRFPQILYTYERDTLKKRYQGFVRLSTGKTVRKLL